jgi:hypothetical protein
VLEPLARDRERIGGFINGATVTAEATAERSSDLERNFALLPQTLRELRTTMEELQRFSDAGIPTFTQLAAAAPAATRATNALGPFAKSTETALLSLGDASAASKAPLVKSDPLIRQIRSVAKSGAPATSDLGRFLRSLDRHGGFKSLLQFVYQGVGATNAFDNLGHFARAFLLITNCNDYETTQLLIDCVANFKEPIETTTAKRADRRRPDAGGGDERRPDASPPAGDEEGSVEADPAPSGDEQAPPPDASPDAEPPPLETEPGIPTTPAEPPPDQTAPDVEVTPSATGRAQLRDARKLLDFLVGSSERRRDRGGKG